jgi:hypothetical protein
MDPVGGHSHVRVWANGALCGTLIMAPAEALDLRNALGTDDYRTSLARSTQAEEPCPKADPWAVPGALGLILADVVPLATLFEVPDALLADEAPK